jgi:hypothetical protein
VLERPAPSFELGPEWSPRLVAFALACVATVAMQLAGSLIAILSQHVGGELGPAKDRVHAFLQVVTPSMGAVVIVGALAVAGARLLGDERRWVRLSVFGAAAAVAGLSVVAMVTEVLWKQDGFGATNLWSRVGVDGAVLLLAVVAAWLTDAWVTEPTAVRA